MGLEESKCCDYLRVLCGKSPIHSRTLSQFFGTLCQPPPTNFGPAGHGCRHRVPFFCPLYFLFSYFTPLHTTWTLQHLMGLIGIERTDKNFQPTLPFRWSGLFIYGCRFLSIYRRLCRCDNKAIPSGSSIDVHSKIRVRDNKAATYRSTSLDSKSLQSSIPPAGNISSFSAGISTLTLRPTLLTSEFPLLS